MGFFDRFKSSSQSAEPLVLARNMNLETLAFLIGNQLKFDQFGSGFSLVSVVSKMGLEPGDKFLFDNSEHLASLLSTRNSQLAGNQIGLFVTGELVATLEDPNLHGLIEKHGGFAAARSEITVNSDQVIYEVWASGARLSKAASNRSSRPPLLKGSFTGIAEVTADVTSRSGGNLKDLTDKILKLAPGNSVIGFGAVCLFRGQESDNVFVQFNGDTIGGVKGPAKEVLRKLITQKGFDDGYRVALAAWLIVSRETSRTRRVNVVLDSPATAL